MLHQWESLCQHPMMISRLQSNQLCQCIHVIFFYQVESVTPQLYLLCSLGLGKMCLLLLGSLRHIYSLGQTYLYSIHCFSSSFVSVFNLCYWQHGDLHSQNFFKWGVKKLMLFGFGCVELPKNGIWCLWRTETALYMPIPKLRGLGSASSPKVPRSWSSSWHGMSLWRSCEFI